MKINWPTQLYIDGKWTPGGDGRALAITNPATGEQLTEVAVAGEREVDQAVRSARRAFDEGPWPKLDPADRARRLWRLADLIRQRADDFSMTDTLNIGKPIRDTKGWDTPVSADLFESYAGLCDKIAGKCFGTMPECVSMQFREPIGVVASIVPWNFPLTNAAIKLAPALACGNCVVLKPSELAPLTALMLADMATEAGLPPGVFNVVNGLGSETGTALVGHPGVDKVSFTGRLETGRQIMKLAADGIKGVTLELGGKTPNIIFPDTSLESAASHVLMGIFIHLGQVCVAASRLLVHERIRDELLDLLLAKVKRLRQGDPTDERNHLGCIATPTHLQSIERHVARAREEGACLVTGGCRPDDPDLAQGCYYQPTIFNGVTPGMTLAHEEVFVPVLAVMTFKDQDEAVRIANDSNFGLMACVWTNDGQRALDVARELRVGKVAINGGGAFRASSPMAGYKHSGIGSDLGLDEAIGEYTNSKTVQYSLAREGLSWPD